MPTLARQAQWPLGAAPPAAQPGAARAGARTCGAVWNRLDVCASSPACSVSAASHRASLWPAALPRAQDSHCVQKGGMRNSYRVKRVLARRKQRLVQHALGKLAELASLASAQQAKQGAGGDTQRLGNTRKLVSISACATDSGAQCIPDRTSAHSHTPRASQGRPHLARSPRCPQQSRGTPCRWHHTFARPRPA